MISLKKIQLLVLLILMFKISVFCQYQNYRVKTISVVSIYQDMAKPVNPDISDTIRYVYNYENGKLNQIIAETKSNDDNLFPDHKKITFSYNKNIITANTQSGKLYKELEFDKSNNLIRYFASNNEYSMKYENSKLISLNIFDQSLNYKENYQTIKYQNDNLIQFEEKSSLYTRIFSYENQVCTGSKFVFKDDTSDIKKRFRIERENGNIAKIYSYNIKTESRGSGKIYTETANSLTEFYYDSTGKITKEVYYLPDSDKKLKIKDIYLIEYENEVGNDSTLFLFNNWEINIFFKQRTYNDLRIFRY